jgi:Xaa-Pro aminopeptidase
MSTRADRLSGLLEGAGVDVTLVTNPFNIRYLTGFTGSNGVAVVGPQTRVFITDFRYVEQAADEVERSFDRRRAPQDLLEDVPGVLPAGQLRLGFEENHVTVRQHARLRELLEERVELVGLDALIERLRAIKEPGEIEAIRAAAGVADVAFARMIDQGLIGRTEREAAITLERMMLEEGAAGPSFGSIVAAGAHGALPHAQPRQVEIQRGDMVVIDWGAQVDGYCSDCTRTIAAGQVPAHARDIYELVLTAQRAGLSAVRAGVSGREADAIARTVIEAAGHGDHFGHGLGHGVGLDVHEAPRLSQRSQHELQDGNVVTVEPGIYLPGEFGVRIEDLVVVREGPCEILSAVGKELIVTG